MFQSPGGIQKSIQKGLKLFFDIAKIISNAEEKSTGFTLSRSVLKHFQYFMFKYFHLYFILLQYLQLLIALPQTVCVVFTELLASEFFISVRCKNNSVNFAKSSNFKCFYFYFIALKKFQFLTQNVGAVSFVLIGKVYKNTQLNNYTQTLQCKIST